MYLIQDRYRRFRGYDREKMTPHTVNQMLTIQMAQHYYERIGEKPKGSPSDMSERDIGHWRTNIAMEALSYVAWWLRENPAGIKASDRAQN